MLSTVKITWNSKSLFKGKKIKKIQLTNSKNIFCFQQLIFKELLEETFLYLKSSNNIPTTD